MPPPPDPWRKSVPGGEAGRGVDRQSDVAHRGRHGRGTRLWRQYQLVGGMAGDTGGAGDGDVSRGAEQVKHGLGDLIGRLDRALRLRSRRFLRRRLLLEDDMGHLASPALPGPHVGVVGDDVVLARQRVGVGGLEAVLGGPHLRRVDAREQAGGTEAGAPGEGLADRAEVRDTQVVREPDGAGKTLDVDRLHLGDEGLGRDRRKGGRGGPRGHGRQGGHQGDGAEHHERRGPPDSAGSQQ